MDLVQGNPTEVKVVLASVATALGITVSIAVTAKLGPTSAAELDSRQEDRLEQHEDREDREDR